MTDVLCNKSSIRMRKKGIHVLYSEKFPPAWQDLVKVWLWTGLLHAPRKKKIGSPQDLVPWLDKNGVHKITWEECNSLCIGETSCAWYLEWMSTSTLMETQPSIQPLGIYLRQAKNSDTNALWRFLMLQTRLLSISE